MTRDRVGIVADVTAALQRLDGNLADLSQSVLRGYFTMIVLASFPDEITEERIRCTFETISEDDPFEVGVRAVSAPLPEEPATSANRYVLTVTGPDRIGFVAAVSRELLRWNVNIVDIASTVREGRYFMFLLLDRPEHLAMGDFRAGLDAATAPLGASYQLQHDDIFRATNEIG